ncbi:hypothetical protein DRE_00915 [Drechslerella stenobrocha 248]|uniref:MARVEL domain-containing protein n=1 Tax=Drechslerella stenobrocha 248 TaxID=1043628 RepID=W7HLH9_9PEZI|nr:hypothetical protein DRE_00915 [Drechslerella stenobrocha 248]
MNPCLTIVLRLAQLVLSVIVLALSVVLLQGQRAGDAPVVTKFSIFLGALGTLMAFFGVISQIFAALRDSKVVGGLDFGTGLLQFAGGVAMAVELGPGVNSCSNKRWREMNSVVNGGYVVVGGSNYVFRNTPFESRCQMAFSVTACEFLLCMTFVAAGVFMIISSYHKKSPVVPKW